MSTENDNLSQPDLLPPHQVLIRPLITEKGTELSESDNVYAFQVNKAATKYDVRRAVEEMFHVKVLRVAIQNRKGKPRRTRARMSQTADWKKAVVKLSDEHRIDFF
ncbi:MAG: 50S ribosomal protein L23 [Pirellulales bacterium]|nr:50S ribosomal protein L23 [Pirellulales bacterium]